MIIQMCGLSGSGKSTIANKTKNILEENGIAVEIIDGDEYRSNLCSDLGFSMIDRHRNIRRLAFVASKFSVHNIVTIICAINPYEQIRKEVSDKYQNVKTVFIDCNLETLKKRDTKGLYMKANLPNDHPEKIRNLSGVNDPFEIPSNPDLVIPTDTINEDESTKLLYEFILSNMI